MSQPVKPKPPKRVQIVEVNGKYRAEYPLHTYRFLMDTGLIIDVMAARDDSDLREEVLLLTKSAGCERIAGSTVLPEPEPAKTVSKRVAKKG